MPYDASPSEHTALRIPMRGQDPVWVDPTELAKNMGLTVKNQRIREDGSVFGIAVPV